jgi:AAA15 family ATPase/GTPase
MLLMFKVKNCTSFKEETILDLRATSYKQHPAHVIEINDKINLLKTNVLYGANASGKSNFIASMFWFKNYILSQLLSVDKKRNTEDIEDSLFSFESFLLSGEIKEESEFDIIFIKNKRMFQYGFECTKDKVINEWYYIDDKKIFERNELKIDLGKRYIKTLSNYKKFPQKRLYLSILDYFLDDNDKEKLYLNDFVDFFVKDFNVFLEINFESSIKEIAGSYSVSNKLINDKNFRKKTEEYLKVIDVGIVGLAVQEEIRINKNTDEEKSKKTIKTTHNVYDNSGDIIDTKCFDLKQESSGTLRFLSYIQVIIMMIENGGVFIVDEMSAKLHPLLTKFIVDLFQEKSNKKAQLIFTTHDISILTNKQFRRDEVVFIDKNINGESNLYALSDLKVREDATFNKDYIHGKYGAIPIFNYDYLKDDVLNA